MSPTLSYLKCSCLFIRGKPKVQASCVHATLGIVIQKHQELGGGKKMCFAYCIKQTLNLHELFRFRVSANHRDKDVGGGELIGAFLTRCTLQPDIIAKLIRKHYFHVTANEIFQENGIPKRFLHVIL